MKAADIKAWQEFLKGHSSQAIEWAFDNWQRNSKFFPRPKDILDLLSTWKTENRIVFEPCNQNGCEDGWVRVFSGQTIGWEQDGGKKNPRPVDTKVGAVKRCQCFINWKNRSAA